MQSLFLLYFFIFIFVLLYINCHVKLSSHSKQSTRAKWQVTRHKESKTCEGEKKEKNNFKDRYYGPHRARLVHVFKNWKLLFENIFGNTCGWKSALKCVKCCLKTKNSCLKLQTKHPHNYVFIFIKYKQCY